MKNLLANAGDSTGEGLLPGSGISPGIGNGNALQYSCLRNPMDKGAWWATVHGVAESDMTQMTEYRDYIDAFFFIFFPLWLIIGH